MSIMKSFQDDTELLKIAEKLLDDNISSLEANVNHCLVPGKDIDHGLISLYATFPAILFCFSIVDLLASLYCGDARGNTSVNAATYMKNMMNYTEDQCHLMQQVFRHKLVHLAGPRTAYKYNEKIIAWNYSHDSPEKHLIIEPTRPGAYVQPTSQIKQNITHVFWIGIKQLVGDIKQSVQNPNGYLSKLKTDPAFRKKFDKAVFEIYSPI